MSGVSTRLTICQGSEEAVEGIIRWASGIRFVFNEAVLIFDDVTSKHTYKTTKQLVGATKPVIQKVNEKDDGKSMPSNQPERKYDQYSKLQDRARKSQTFHDTSPKLD